MSGNDIYLSARLSYGRAMMTLKSVSDVWTDSAHPDNRDTIRPAR